MPFIWIATLAMLSAAFIEGTQVPPNIDRGVVGGRVLAADTGLPVRGATVRLVGRTIQRTIPADDEGYFEFGEIPPGAYLLTAVMAGYAIGASGQRSPSEMPRSFELGARETRGQADIHLTPLGRISGRIVDEAGAPAAKVQVQAVRRRRSLTDEPRIAFNGGATDSNGVFTVSGLPAGHYYIIATLRPTRALQSQPAVPSPFTLASTTYYPGTALPSGAQTVRVDLGIESTGVSFALQPSRLARVTGIVVDSRGRPAADAVVTLGNASTEVPEPMTLGTISEVADDGGFSLVDVPPGVYSLDVRSKAVYEAIASTGGGGIEQIRASPEFASVPLHVTGEDLHNLVVRTDAGFTLSGRLVVEGPMPAQSLRSIRVSASHVGEAALHSRYALSGAAGVRPDTSFEVQKLLGRQIIRVSGLPGGWGLKRVALGSIDLTDEGIDVSLDVAGVDVVVARQSEISGLVADRRGLPIPGATVVVFSEERQRWEAPFTRFVKSALSTSSGAFTIAGLPAGRYYAAVVPAVVEGRLADPDDLEPLVSSASRLTLGEGERRSLNLRLE